MTLIAFTITLFTITGLVSTTCTMYIEIKRVLEEWQKQRDKERIISSFKETTELPVVRKEK